VTKRPSALRLVPLHGLPEITPGSDLAALIREAARAQGETLANRIVVVCQKIVSKAEGRLVELAGIEPSALAREIGAEHGRDPRQVEVVLRESRRIVRRGRGVLITETHHGYVCANSGVDLSNAPGPDVAVLLPATPTRRPAGSSKRSGPPTARPPSSSATPSAAPGARGSSTSPSAARAWPRSGTTGAPSTAPAASSRSPNRRPRTSSPPRRAADVEERRCSGRPRRGFPFEGDGSVQKSLLRDSATDLFR